MSVTPPAIPVLDSIEDLGGRYRAWLVDIWGVMHNGRTLISPRRRRRASLPRAGRHRRAALKFAAAEPKRARRSCAGWASPTPATTPRSPRAISPGTSLPSTLAPACFISAPSATVRIFDGLDVVLVGPDEAELIVCSGLFDDETETPDDYADLLRDLAARDLPMICANPDHLVERGHQLIYCAGALAAVYEREGGSVVYAGKPYAPIYELALETIDRLAGESVAKDAILAIGDGINTDIAGAAAAGIDSVFVASGLHVPGGGEEELDREHLAELFAHAKRRPLGAIRALAW